VPAIRIARSCQATVAKYMVRRRQPPSQRWRTFLRNHIGRIVAADFFVVPTATYGLLFVLVVLAHDRRRIRHFAAQLLGCPRRGRMRRDREVPPLTERPHEPLDEGILPRRTRSREHLLDPHRLRSRPQAIERVIAIVKQVSMDPSVVSVSIT